MPSVVKKAKVLVNHEFSIKTFQEEECMPKWRGGASVDVSERVMKVEDTRVEMANTAVSVRSYQSAERCSTAHSFYKGSVSSCSKLSACSRDENLTPRMFLDRYDRRALQN